MILMEELPVELICFILIKIPFEKIFFLRVLSRWWNSFLQLNLSEIYRLYRLRNPTLERIQFRESFMENILTIKLSFVKLDRAKRLKFLEDMTSNERLQYLKREFYWGNMIPLNATSDMEVTDLERYIYLREGGVNHYASVKFAISKLGERESFLVSWICRKGINPLIGEDMSVCNMSEIRNFFWILRKGETIFVSSLLSKYSERDISKYLLFRSKKVCSRSALMFLKGFEDFQILRLLFLMKNGINHYSCRQLVSKLTDSIETEPLNGLQMCEKNWLYRSLGREKTKEFISLKNSKSEDLEPFLSDFRIYS